VGREKLRRGLVHADGWRAPVVEPATGLRLGTVGIGNAGDVTRAGALAARRARRRRGVVADPNVRVVAFTGIVHINDQTVNDEAHAPFGGVDASGTGSRLGGADANVEAFTETQWVTVRGDIAPYPF